jgi:hypothetical protein
VLSDHFQAFVVDYDRCYRKTWGPLRPVVARTVGAFLRCGLPEWGVARLRCKGCASEYLLPLSCGTRGLCPSCGAKRCVAWARWVATTLARRVPHRQVVVTLPKILRPYFRYERSLLTELSRWVYECVCELLGTLADEPVRPGCVSVLEQAGNLLDPQPHLHQIVTSGAFDHSGCRFYPAPDELWRLLEERVRTKVLEELLDRGLITRERREMLLSWRHSGFSVHVGREAAADDRDGLERIARYARRLHVADSRVHYDEQKDRVLYSSGKKVHPKYKANFRVFEARDFVAHLAGFIPDPYHHETIAYGEYSNVVRGLRLKARTEPRLAVQAVSYRRAYAAWRELIKHVYEVDPLTCPRCGDELRLVALLVQADVIEKIMRHLGMWPPPFRPPKASRAPPAQASLPFQDPPSKQEPDEESLSQVPPGWDDDEAFSQVPPGWDDE